MAVLRRSLPLEAIAARHVAGESLRSLAAAHGTTVHTLSRHLRRGGYEVRSRRDANVAENLKRPRGVGARGGKGTPRKSDPAKVGYEYIRDLRAKKAEIVAKWKNERGCQHCGESHPATLDLHHPDPAGRHPRLRRRKGGRPSIGGYSWRDLSYEDLAVELEKCIVLCANCHRKEHAPG